MMYLRNLLLAIYISSSILIILANLLIIFIILYSPLLRIRPRNHIILSIAVADLLLGSFVTPMLTTSLIENTVQDCNTHLAMQVIGDHGIFFVVGWEIVTFNIFHIRESNLRFSWKFFKFPVSSCLKNFILASWPWFAALCILVPIIIRNASIHVLYTIHDDIMCMMLLPQNVSITVFFFSLYLPFYVCVAALVSIIVFFSKGYHKQPQSNTIQNNRVSSQEDATEQLTQPQSCVSTENPLYACIPNTVYLVCYAPLIVHSWLHFSKIYVPYTAYGVILFGLLARSFLLPLTWLAFKDIRSELKEYETRLKVACSMCFSNPRPSTVSSVSFSRLQETQTV